MNFEVKIVYMRSRETFCVAGGREEETVELQPIRASCYPTGYNQRQSATTIDLNGMFFLITWVVLVRFAPHFQCCVGKHV